MKLLKHSNYAPYGDGKRNKKPPKNKSAYQRRGLACITWSVHEYRQCHVISARAASDTLGKSARFGAVCDNNNGVLFVLYSVKKRLELYGCHCINGACCRISNKTQNSFVSGKRQKAGSFATFSIFSFPLLCLIFSIFHLQSTWNL